jgi:hypothetical protein
MTKDLKVDEAANQDPEERRDQWKRMTEEDIKKYGMEHFARR